MNFRLFLLFGLMASVSFAQEDIKRDLYYGNEAFTSGDYEKAAGYYLDAVDQSPLNFKANYNLANAYYRMAKFEKAVERMTTVVNLAPTSFDKAKAYHNIGNCHMMVQDWDGAIEAYKNALRLNPSDEETRYNLAYAQQMKKDQEDQDRENSEGGGGDGMGDSEDDNSGEPQDDEGEDSGDQNNNGDQNDEQNPNEDDSQGDQGDEENPQDGSGQQYNAKLSKDQIDQMLKEYYQREKELMRKINKDKKGGYGAPRKKDW